MKNKFALALLASAAMVAALATDASAAGHGGGGHGGGGGGGGGGGHGGGGGGFHGGGGGFHGGSGGFHAISGAARMGGGGFHPGGGGFHAAAPYGGGGMRMGGFHGGALHIAPHAAGPHFAPHSFANRGPGAQGPSAHANVQPGVNRNLTGVQQGRGAQRLMGHAAAGAAGAAAVTHAQFAHNQFAAHNFHGLHNFNRTGFNRNAFGDPKHWNRWGGHFWGCRLASLGSRLGRLGRPGLLALLYGDIFTFAFWPYDYYDPFWAYGPDFVLVSIFAPGPYFGADYGYAPDYGYVPGATGGYAGRDVYYGGGGATFRGNQGGSPGACGNQGGSGGKLQRPCAGRDRSSDRQIKQTVQPSGDQLTALDDLNAAAAKARAAIKASCPTAVPLTPVARLDAAQARLEAVIEAAGSCAEPLQRFYDSLTDEQKHRFETMGSSGGPRQAPAGGNIAALCGQQSGDATNLPIERIEQVVQPNGHAQQSAFDALKQASRDAAPRCRRPAPQVPQTPVARLDAVKTRLQAMVDAMNTIEPKLQAFYASLSDEQKARFNTMGPAQSAAAGAAPQNE